MKIILMLTAYIAFLSATSGQDPNGRKFRKNYQLLQAIGVTSSYRDAKCLTILDNKYPENCTFFADSTAHGSPIIWAEMRHQDGTFWFQFTVHEQGSTLDDKAAYTKAQRKCAQHFYQTLTKASMQKK